MGDQRDDLDDFVGETESEGQEASTEPEAPAEAAQGTETAASHDGSTPQTVEEPDPLDVDPAKLGRSERGLLEAAKSERKKRQKLEETLKEFDNLKAQVAELSKKVPQPKERAEDSDSGPTMFEDPDAWLANKLGAQGVMTREEFRFQTALNNSWAKMKAEHQDYEETEREFVAMAKDDPQLQRQMRAHPEPARFAYEFVKSQHLAKQHGGVSGVAKRIADLEAQIQALKGAGTTTVPQEKDEDQPIRSQAGARGAVMTAPASSGDPFDLSDFGAGSAY